MATATNPAAAAFAFRLERLMREKGFDSKRAFGKLCDPDDPERGRRRVQRHLSGRFMPSPGTVKSYARILGVSVKELDPEAEDEESDQAMPSDLQAQVREVKRGLAKLERSVRGHE